MIYMIGYLLGGLIAAKLSDYEYSLFDTKEFHDEFVSEKTLKLSAITFCAIIWPVVLPFIIYERVKRLLGIK